MLLLANPPAHVPVSAASHRLMAMRAARGGGPDSAEGGCTASVGPGHRIKLPDGRVVHIDLKSSASNGTEVALAGTPIWAWLPTAGPEDRPTSGPRPLGLILRGPGDSVATPIPNPLTTGHVVWPRVASAGAAGWHMLLVQRPTARFDFSPEGEPLTLWYGLFDGKRWHRLTPLLTTRGARFEPAFSSGLAVHGPDLAFAFATKAAERPPAVVLLRRQGGTWRVDSLPTLTNPRSVRLLPWAGGAWLLGFSVPHLEDGRLTVGGLFVSRVGRTIEAPRTLLRSATHGYNSPAFFAVGSQLLATWWEQRSGAAPDGPMTRVLWASWDRETWEPTGAGRAFDNDMTFAPVALDTSGVVWLARDYQADPARTVKVAFVSGGRSGQLNSISLTNDTDVVPFAHGGRVFLTHSRVAWRKEGFPAASYVSPLQLTCTTRDVDRPPSRPPVPLSPAHRSTR